MIFDRFSRLVKTNADFEKKKVRNRKYGSRKVVRFLPAFIVVGIALPMLAGCGQVNADEAISETTMEETESTFSGVATPFSDIEAISNSAIGEYVTFGSYEQDNDPDNGAEPIEWIVLNHQDGKTLLLSKYSLDSAWYHTERSVDVTWETCSLRRWLNTGFYNTAFNDTEKDMIVQITNENKDGTSFWESMGRTVESSIGGNDTQDNVFALSLYEVQTYLGTVDDNNPNRICTATMYAESKGINSPSKYCWWWLRTPGDQQVNAAVINDSGRELEEFIYHEYKNTPAVRPAIWVGEGVHGEITDLPAISEPEKEEVKETPAEPTVELTADGCGGLYSGSYQGQYYYVWLEMGSFASSESPSGTIRLLWEGNEPYAEGSELSQDTPHDFYMGDVDDAYMIKPGWNNVDASILTIDQDEFGEYSGKIFCFGFWMNKDDSLIYDGTLLHYRN